MSNNYNQFLSRNLLYLTITVIVIAVIVGTVFVIQHLYANGLQEQIIHELNISLSNQHEIIENQKLIKNLTENLNMHEEFEFGVLKDGNDVSFNNSLKLDLIDKKLNKLLVAHNLPIPRN